MVIFCEASVSTPLMHNVARNMKQHVRNPCAVCVRPWRSVLGPGALYVGPRRCLCRAPALSVGALRSPCRAGAVCRGPALSRSLCPGTPRVGLRRFPGPSATGALCVAAGAHRKKFRRSLRRNPASPADPQFQSVCHPSGPRAPTPIRVPPIWSAGPPAQIRVPPSPSRSLFQERTPNLTVWGIINKVFGSNNKNNSNSNNHNEHDDNSKRGLFPHASGSAKIKVGKVAGL